MAGRPPAPSADERLGHACPGCGLTLPEHHGPTHDYMTASASCWARFGELLAAQYVSPARMAFHQLIVDAYAAQHPGGTDRRAVQSVGIHLMTLALVLEHGADPANGPRLHKAMLQRPTFGPLTGRLPASTDRTVVDVPLDGSAEDARAAVWAWAEDVWRSWSAGHSTVRGWLESAGLVRSSLTPRPVRRGKLR